MDASREPCGTDAGRARHARISEIFALVCDAPPGQRAAILARECGDDGPLRAAVEDLLATEDRPPHAGWLEQPAAVVAPRQPGWQRERSPRTRRRRVIATICVLALTCSAAWMLASAWTRDGAGVRGLGAAMPQPANAAEAKAAEPELRRLLAACLADSGPVDRAVIEVALSLARCLQLQGLREEAASLARAARLVATDALPAGDPLLGALDRLGQPAAPGSPPPAAGGLEG